MPIEVSFRGPILFAHKDGSLVEALIPNAETAGTHDDGTTAKQHFAGILVLDKDDRFLKRFDLGRRTVTITSSSANGPATLLPKFSDKVALEPMVNDGASSQDLVTLASTATPAWDRVNTIIRIKGGTLSAGNKTARSFEIPSHRGAVKMQPIPLLTTWRSDKDPVTIGIFDSDGATAQRPIELGSGEQVFIYHWDHDEPEPGKGRLTQAMSTSQIFGLDQDLDFKWLYKLLDPPTGQTWQDWLSEGGTVQNGAFPAPRTTILVSLSDLEEPMSVPFPPSSACDGAIWP